MLGNAPQDSEDHWLNRPLAIIGMGCRLPGADGLDAYWDLLLRGGYAIERMPDSKLNRQLYYDPEKGKRGQTYSDIGGFVDERDLDWTLLDLDPAVAADWDPCHLNFCEVAAQACRHAGFDPRNLPLRNVGVYVGHSGGSTLGGEIAYRKLTEVYVKLLEELPEWSSSVDGPQQLRKELLERLQANRPQRQDGKPYVDAGFVAALTSRVLGLSGPHMAIDAACASSLVALALGANSLHAGETEMAIIGGASFNKSDSLILFSHAQSCSATATRPFDAAADGLISSEGYVAIVIKTLERALADGDQVQAIIRGIGLASDGRGRSLWAPRKEGQYAAISRAYSKTVTPDQVQMIEAHATSTQVGDATEMEALSSFYQQHCAPGKRLPVGSVKSNIGHTLETAGLAGLVKAVLAIQQATIPPSINVQELNRSIPWSQIPLEVPRQASAWPSLPTGQPRRAVVNAFGIGGLNVHVVLDQFLEATAAFSVQQRPIKPSIHQAASRAASVEPIAIIGRGVVLPGALSIAELVKFLACPTRQIIAPPSDRASCHDAAFITQFAYDWRKHKVPPKQIAQANPLQFMLLDAAEQALVEAKLLERDFDRQHTAVVVGSIFGGDFGNALYAGLRLPEFREQLRQLLMSRGIAPAQTQSLLDAYESHFLRLFPALIDETGSFTSSTLASRLSKTFDLMGGAMSLDAGDVSGLAAVNVACQLLRGGTVTHVLCAAAQRALDCAAMESYEQNGRLLGPPPSEGVALLLLKRLDAAQRDGDRILSVISAVGVGANHCSLSSSVRQATRGLGNVTLPAAVGAVGLSSLDQQVMEGLTAGSEIAPAPLGASPLLESAGYLHGAQGVVDIILETLEPTTNRVSKVVVGHALSGQSYVVELNRTVTCSQPNPILATTRATLNPRSLDTSSIAIFRFAAASMVELQQLLLGLANQSSAAISRSGLNAFSNQRTWRACAISTLEELPSQCSRLAKQLGNRAAAQPLAEQGLLWCAPDDLLVNPRVAWLFPGQGSQSPGMLRELVESDAAARQALYAANVALTALGQPTFEHIAWQQNNLLGESVWHTQAAVLIADWIVMRSLLNRGLRPDLVLGHSYGEVPAMLAAGCWDLASALQATWWRCQAVIQNVATGLGMLSVHADRMTTQRLIDANQLPLSISHYNAPLQTVVGGKQAAVSQLAQIFEQEGIHSRLLSVPTAFHTPWLSAAVEPFAAALAEIEIRTPSIPLLSSVTNEFATDPAAMRVALAQQLVQPLDFVASIRRLQAEGVQLAVEVGPQQVLTRLVRQIDRHFQVVPTDHVKRGATFQVHCAQATLELLTYSPTSVNAHHSSTCKPQVSPDETKRSLPAPVLPIAPVHFDATVARRERLRLSSKSSDKWNASSLPVVSAATHYDATRIRRDSMRLLAEGKVPSAPASIPDEHITTPANNPEHLTATIAQFLIDFVVEQTGYPAEIIELDWDLEADLGIDSIKKAQLFGELREFFDLESHRELKLDRFQTLRSIVELLAATPGKGDWLEQASSSQLVEDAMESCQADETQAESVVPCDLVHGDLQQFLVDFVVEQTGYPAEIVELDADLEADLGIDSIKKAQLFGELREMFDFQPTAGTTTVDAPRGGLVEYRTLRQVLEALTDNRPAVNLVEGASPGLSLAPSPDDDAPRSFVPPPVQPTTREFLPTQRLPTHLLPNPGLSASMTGRSCVVHADQLPTARLDALGSIQVTPAFQRSAERNVQALAGRCSEGGEALAAAAQNGNAQWGQARTERMATATSLLDKTLSALDRALQVQARWVRLKLDVGTPPTNICWLAELELPAWLSDVEHPMAAVETEQVVNFGPAGTIHHLAQVIDGQILRMGGVDAAHATHSADYAKLAVHFQKTSPRSIDEAVSSARTLELEFDWWMLLVDARDSKQALIECCRGTLIIEKGGLDRSGLSTPSNRPRIGLDVNNKQFVVQVNSHVSSNDAPSTTETPQPALEETNLSTTPKVTSRYVLRMVPAPLRTGRGRQPQWAGTALVVGDNPIARQLESRLRGAGVETVRWAADEDPRMLASAFQALSVEKKVPHLFLTTPCDVDAKFSLDQTWWETRREKGVMGIFWLCQKWLTHVTESALADEASLVLVSSLGGDFGVGNDAASDSVGRFHSAEGGGLAGLLKSILVESWMQGMRSLPIKVIDTCVEDSPGEVVNNIWMELANPSYNVEIAYRRGVRHALRAIAKPNSGRREPMKPGGTWVLTGGARGITAYVAEQLGKRYGLNLHLLGVSPVPSIAAAWRDLDESGLRELKAKIMKEARDAGKNAVKTWQDTEKLIEIDATLHRFKQLGLKVHYHSCDVSDRAALRQTLDQVRSLSGPITGVLHGAGVGRDARYDRKQPDKVQQCISAKVDGALALMEATKQDPLNYFVGFGSISGRFGANGHADYSLANDMLCKEIAWFHRQRPEVKCVGFHWHAWGDVGMATKPETRLALELIDMQFMPAAEGFEHLINELEGESDESEVLITDERYYRMYYPSETIVPAHRDAQGRLLAPLIRAELSPRCGGERAFVARVDPAKDPFLTEHLLDARPILPYVLAIELLIEAAALHADATNIVLQDVQAASAIRYFHDAPSELRIETRTQAAGEIACRLYSDFTARDGRLVQADRQHFQATALLGEMNDWTGALCRHELPAQPGWELVRYPTIESKFYVGWPLRRLRRVTLLDGGLVGTIAAPALTELAGPLRDTRGWFTASSALDACLFATGILAWQQVQPGSALPVKFGRLIPGRLPIPGEACEVHVRLKGNEATAATFDFTLYGVDGDVIFNAVDYEVAWLQAETTVGGARSVHLGKS